jgi:polyphosphate kinase 2 (PPK2 family)
MLPDKREGTTEMDFRKKFAVEPESKVRLSKIDPSYSGKHSREEVQSEIQRHVERIDKSQYLLYADGNQSLLIVLQALDAAGKDGVIRHVFSGMNPQGTFVYGFKQPSKNEAAHDFLWRAHLRTPGVGEVPMRRTPGSRVAKPTAGNSYKIQRQPRQSQHKRLRSSLRYPH